MTASATAILNREPAASSPLPMAAVTTAVVAWGFGAILVKVMSIDGISLSFYRLWLGSLLMLAVVAVTRTRVTAAGLRSALPGGVVFGVNVVLFFSAVNHTTIANANLISALQPALVLVVAAPSSARRSAYARSPGPLSRSSASPSSSSAPPAPPSGPPPATPWRSAP